jgi:hypothetical protein
MMDLFKVARRALADPFDFTKGAQFRASLPQHLATWASHVLASAMKYDVSPWFIMGVIERESLGGLALKPPDASGTGDFQPRRASSRYFRYAKPTTGMPPDGLGWGRGLMQIDYGVHNSWCLTNNWKDPTTNIDYGTSILRDNLIVLRSHPGQAIDVELWRWTKGMPQYNIQPWATKYPHVNIVTKVFDPRPLGGAILYEGAIAAFNAGTSGVLQAIGSGLPAEAATTGQDYVSWFLQRIGTWAVQYNPGWQN